MARSVGEQIQGGEQDKRYEFAEFYIHEEAKQYPSGILIDPIVANASSLSRKVVAGQIVRLECERAGGAKVDEDGVIVIDRLNPTSIGVGRREALENKLGKLINRLTGNMHQSTYTPVDESVISQDKAQRLRRTNERYRSMKVERR